MACANPFDPEEGLRQQREHEALEAKITELWGHLNAAIGSSSWLPSSTVSRRSRVTALSTRRSG